MKKFTIFIVGFFLVYSFSFSQTDWNFITELKVGKRPVSIFQLDEQSTFSNIWLIYCAGIDLNHNGTEDIDDEPPSIWCFTSLTYMITTKEDFFGKYSEPVKLVDLEFQDVKLPTRIGLSYENETRKVYIPEPTGVTEIAIKIQSNDPFLLDIAKSTIINEKVNAISAGINRNNSKVLYLSKRDLENKTGNVLVYDFNSNQIVDTLPASTNVQMTLPLDYRNVLVLNESVSPAVQGSYLNYHVGGNMGPNKHYLINDIKLQGNPNHICFHNTLNGDINTVITSFDSDTIRIYDGNFTLKEIKLNMAGATGARETILGVDRQLYTTSYDGFVYIYNSNLQSIDKLPAYGKAESVAETYFILLIATPYLDSSDIADSTITFYSKEPVSVDDNSENNILKVFPNPADEYITINQESISNKYEIYSILGEKLIVSTQNTINISKLTKGTYYIKSNMKYFLFVKN
jgi:hypothetical protein